MEFALKNRYFKKICFITDNHKIIIILCVFSILIGRKIKKKSYIVQFIPNIIFRHDIINQSKLMGTQERQQFAKKIMSPLESIAKHLTDHSAIEESKFENQNSETTSISITRYHEMNLDDKQKNGDLMLNNDSEIYSDLNNGGIVGDTTILSNHKLILDEDYTSTEKYEINAQKMIMSTEKNFLNCDNTTIIDNNSKAEKKSIDFSKGIDATEAF